ncbi:MAG: flagellar basal body rod protein FlgB [Nitrospinae bacterium]|nr:flagellar basal body rod protein FlgB [Nitrospinota bacterium]
MDISKIYGENIDIFKKVLDLRSERHNIISSNIANIDTPNYKSVDISFEEQLRSAADSGSGKGLKKTNDNHLPGGVRDIENIMPEINIDNTPSGIDGNNVDIDKEVTKMAENTIMYNAVAQLIRQEFEDLKYTIDQGGSK